VAPEAYDQLCVSYRGIDDFRAKLLGFLPLASGAGILAMAKDSPSLLQNWSQPIAVFGFLITLGLFCYEIYGITKCAELIRAGKKIELAQEIQGQFCSRPQAVRGWINEPFAAGIIYPAVLASWTAVGFIRPAVQPSQGFQPLAPVAWVAAGLVFLSGLGITVLYDRTLKEKDRTQCDGCTRPFECGENPHVRTTTLKTSPDYWLCRECSDALKRWVEDRRSHCTLEAH